MSTEKLRAAMEKEAAARRNMDIAQRAAFAARDRFQAAIAMHAEADDELSAAFDKYGGAKLNGGGPQNVDTEAGRTA